MTTFIDYLIGGVSNGAVIALIASVFVAALLGSAHCAGMCGGLACFVAGTGVESVTKTNHLLFTINCS